MNSRKLYYLDNNATTPVAPEVVEAMLPFLKEFWGNPSSAYQFGNQLARHIEEARAKVAALIHADPREVIFTSCGTESNNTALHSALLSNPGKRHLLMTAVEHSANVKYGKHLQQLGYEVTFLPVDTDGSLDLHLLESSIRPDTAIVSVMWANNETGVLYPVEEVAAICRSKGALFHTDAVQAAGKVKIDVRAVSPDFLSLSAHKIYAPKGVGMLYVRRQLPFQPYLIGGGQERGRRGGTENVASIVAFGRAAELASEHLAREQARLGALRDHFESHVLKGIAGVSRNGCKEPRLPNTSNLSFDSVEAEAVLLMLDRAGICGSSGSACTTGSLAPSHVLVAMGMSPARARSSLRFSLGRYTTPEEIDFVLKELPPIIQKLRAVSPDDRLTAANRANSPSRPASQDEEKPGVAEEALVR